MSAGARAVVAGGTVAGIGAIISGLGITVLFSKHNPGMSNKPPVSWTNIDEGIEVYNKFGGNSYKSAEHLLNKFRGKGNWDKGAGSELKKKKKMV